MIDIKSSTIPDVFAYLLEIEGHAALDPDAKSDAGYGFMPNWGCSAFRGGGFSRSICPACLALRKYRLDRGETEEEIDANWRELHPKWRRV